MHVLIISLTCAGLAACTPYDAPEAVKESPEMAGVKDNPAKLLLEGTLAPKPSRPPLNRSLVTGSDAPKGSKKLMRVEDQVLFESSEPGVKAETGLPPDVENQADVTPPVRTGL